MRADGSRRSHLAQRDFLQLKLACGLLVMWVAFLVCGYWKTEQEDDDFCCRTKCGATGRLLVQQMPVIHNKARS